MSNGARYDMLQAATGNGSDVIINSGGKFTFLSKSTAGSYGTVKLQLKDPDGSYLDVASGSHSADGTLFLELPPGTYRAVAATVTANAYLVKH